MKSGRIAVTLATHDFNVRSAGKLLAILDSVRPCPPT